MTVAMPDSPFLLVLGLILTFIGLFGLWRTGKREREQTFKYLNLHRTNHATPNKEKTEVPETPRTQTVRHHHEAGQATLHEALPEETLEDSEVSARQTGT